MRTVSLKSVKGNYLNDQMVSPEKPFESLWFEIGGVNKGEEYLAAAYRTFILKYMSENPESRKPYIFYNTWGRQEKVKWSRQTYLTTMNLNYTLKEIETAELWELKLYLIKCRLVSENRRLDGEYNLIPGYPQTNNQETYPVWNETRAMAQSNGSSSIEQYAS